MKFSVIYSVDCADTEHIGQYLPHNRKLWTLTEGNEEYEYGDIWPKGKHRKLCAVLTKAQFDRFLSQVNIWPEDCETMGSLGAPGLGFGLSPAISFSSEPEDGERAARNAYVTPIPEVCNWPEGKGFSERHWKILRKVILERYY